MYNWAKMREGDKHPQGNKGRGTDPGRKGRKEKRQTNSLETHYHHVKYEHAAMSISMRSLCKGPDLGKS